MFVQLIEGRLKDPANWDTLLQMEDRWACDETDRAPGYMGEDYLRDRSDPCHFMAIARFESVEKAQENSARPETNAFYQAVLPLFEAGPRFVDCDLVHTITR
jgi:quinol monooxygenase YgiN